MMVIILLPALVRPQVFQLAVKLAKIFERKYKSKLNGLVRFYGISSNVGYLKPNPVFKH